MRPRPPARPPPVHLNFFLPSSSYPAMQAVDPLNFRSATSSPDMYASLSLTHSLNSRYCKRTRSRTHHFLPRDLLPFLAQTNRKNEGSLAPSSPPHSHPFCLSPLLLSHIDVKGKNAKIPKGNDSEFNALSQCISQLQIVRLPYNIRPEINYN